MCIRDRSKLIVLIEVQLGAGNSGGRLGVTGDDLGTVALALDVGHIVIGAGVIFGAVVLVEPLKREGLGLVDGRVVGSISEVADGVPVGNSLTVSGDGEFTVGHVGIGHIGNSNLEIVDRRARDQLVVLDIEDGNSLDGVVVEVIPIVGINSGCLLYTSDAADE